MSIIIRTKHTSNHNGRGQVIAKGGGKQRTISWEHKDSNDRNHGNAAGTLALALGLSWHDGITHEHVDMDNHYFTF